MLAVWAMATTFLSVPSRSGGRPVDERAEAWASARGYSCLPVKLSTLTVRVMPRWGLSETGDVVTCPDGWYHVPCESRAVGRPCCSSSQLVPQSLLPGRRTGCQPCAVCFYPDGPRGDRLGRDAGVGQYAASPAGAGAPFAEPDRRRTRAPIRGSPPMQSALERGSAAVCRRRRGHRSALPHRRMVLRPYALGENRSYASSPPLRSRFGRYGPDRWCRVDTLPGFNHPPAQSTCHTPSTRRCHWHGGRS